MDKPTQLSLLDTDSMDMDLLVEAYVSAEMRRVIRAKQAINNQSYQSLKYEAMLDKRMATLLKTYLDMKKLYLSAD